MHVTSSSLIAAFLGATLSSAVPLEARQDALLPFEVTQIGSSNPPVRPGAHPWRFITATFTDPNPYPFFVGEHDGSVPGGLQGINCEAKWYRDESPEGRTWPCDPVSQGHFAIQILPGANGPADVKDFKLKLIHGVEPGTSFSKVLDRVEAEVGPFTYPDTLGGSDPMRGPCLKSGWCSYVVREVPLLAPANKTV
ncbi:hypothetical protein OPT61_g4263 [Boeremia exigua]|uniref:Uncharacterized protein n=1 Tax=Boeremia exigua TaxID=749465 RepID=A0ACC2IEX7_9PLEO|nr:hypothetical protein OPT61_g4263 [Boeremia exigua]